MKWAIIVFYILLLAVARTISPGSSRPFLDVLKQANPAPGVGVAHSGSPVGVG